VVVNEASIPFAEQIEAARNALPEMSARQRRRHAALMRISRRSTRTDSSSCSSNARSRARGPRGKGQGMIIDVDSHFEPGSDWLEPYPELAKRLPKVDPALLAVHTIVGDVLRDVPEAERPAVAELLPPGLLTLFGEEKAGEAARRAEFAGKQQFQKANASARVKWLDGQGIDLPERDLPVGHRADAVRGRPRAAPGGARGEQHAGSPTRATRRTGACSR
jgi:hypothetical protein